MDIFLLPKRNGRYQIYSKAVAEIFNASMSAAGENAKKPTALPEETNDGPPPTAEAPSTARRIWQALKAGYMTLTKDQRRLESTLKSLNESGDIQLHYPAALDSKTALEIYQTLISAQVDKHRKWLIVDGALLPFSVILTLIPGPNVILAYLAWRTLGHYRSHKHAKGSQAKEYFDFYPEAALDDLQELVESRWILKRKEKINLIGERMNIPDLANHY